MSLRIIIPVKPFAEAKQRLAPVLSATERARLAQEMFRHVYATALRCFPARTVVVVSRSSQIIDYARSGGAIGLVEADSSDLNRALAQAAELTHGVSKLFVLASDLPLLGEEDIALMSANECAIAPDRHLSGTNALLCPTRPLSGFFFGENSFERHCTALKAAGFNPKIVRRTGLAHDVDVPADLLSLPERWSKL